MSEPKIWNIRLQLGSWVATVPIKHHTAQQAHALALAQLNIIAADNANQEAEYMFSREYIAGCLDSRGMPTDDDTVTKAQAEWCQTIASYEDDFFTTVMNDNGIEGDDDAS